jgi:hypothetical protein
MSDIITGLLFLFVVPSVCYFWCSFIYLQKTKQVDIPKEIWRL